MFNVFVQQFKNNIVKLNKKDEISCKCKNGKCDWDMQVCDMLKWERAQVSYTWESPIVQKVYF